jgi:serine/threonine protein kinase
MSAIMSVPIGKIVVSKQETKYRIVQHLANGGNCDVFLTVAVAGERKGLLFALKIFMRVDDAARTKRFFEEIELLRNSDHPAIMKIFDDGNLRVASGGTFKEYPFAIADYYPLTLAEAMRRQLWLPQKVIYTLQLLSALYYLESRSPPIVHRDVKPQNIFVKGHSCALGDFGLMKALDTNKEPDEVIIKASSGPGMPKWYRTPDLVAYGRGEQVLTCSSDIFQLGLVAAELFSGRNPLKRAEKFLDPVELETLREIPGTLGLAIKDGIEGMLVLEVKARESVQRLLEQWEGILSQVADHYNNLEGKVF